MESQQLSQHSPTSHGKVVMVIQKVSSEIFFLSRVKAFEQIYIIQLQLSIYNISSIFRFLKFRLID